MDSEANNQSTVPKKGPNDFIFGRVLGDGSFSTVYLAKDIQTGKEFAIKVCEKRHIMREKKQQYVKREKEVLMLLSDKVKTSAPFFVRLYCTFHDHSSLYFVLTRATNGDLLTYLQKAEKFDEEVAQFYTAELVHAVEHMHLLGVVHRDLKPENILLDTHRHILITDFGSAKIIPQPPFLPDADNSSEGTARRSSFVGTAQYVSPEILTDKRSSPASDLWAIGCVLYQMLEGNPPFQARSEYAIFQKILKLEFEYPALFPSVAQDFISKLLVIDSKERLGAQDFGGYPSIKQHRFFQSIDFETLYLKTPPCPSKCRDTVDLVSEASDPSEFLNAEPGLSGQQLSKLLGLHLNDEPSDASRKSAPEPSRETSSSISSTTSVPPPPAKKGLIHFPENEQQLQARLLQQQKTQPQWHNLVDKKLILKQGLIDKRKGLFSRRRMFLLTLGPNLYYVDPSNMVLKGQVPFGLTLKAEPKNFKNFHIHTPGRTYYLEDSEGFALEWCKALEEVRKHYYD
ncbi:putative PDK-1 [Daphnia pulex]|uniref:3-phosphoinositide-dependent protein kinase 1 n=1 Tax=Daphnia pulex TaxID=6669 RepID=E9H687_DAPPU|nr:putative PDK-1 [Daphnia pulex]|eukprot:EFX72775.1 putative PDK-1 [Daphnia pulex]